MATSRVLVAVLNRKTPFFGDEAPSRRHFEPGNSLFWRRALISSPFWGGKLDFLATRLFLVVILSRETPFFGDEPFSRRYFWPENLIFWRRALISSPFWGGKLDFLATSPFLVVILSRETPFFGDEPFSHRRFGVENSIFWRRAAFSSSFLGQKVMFLATSPVLVAVLG
ncbi:hypothetical protein [Caldibacillus thermoamylovorans]|uniref:hypothetical protein n=1 Tax=Caldibacillus thermoamylovorans TaxID=35841 RepID=UPI00126A062A|nr:hypothetical protein [Caldibacillus thermoamylovorans]